MCEVVPNVLSSLIILTKDYSGWLTPGIRKRNSVPWLSKAPKDVRNLNGKHTISSSNGVSLNMECLRV